MHWKRTKKSSVIGRCGMSIQYEPNGMPLRRSNKIRKGLFCGVVTRPRMINTKTFTTVTVGNLSRSRDTWEHNSGQLANLKQ